MSTTIRTSLSLSSITVLGVVLGVVKTAPGLPLIELNVCFEMKSAPGCHVSSREKGGTLEQRGWLVTPELREVAAKLVSAIGQWENRRLQPKGPTRPVQSTVNKSNEESKTSRSGSFAQMRDLAKL